MGLFKRQTCNHDWRLAQTRVAVVTDGVDTEEVNLNAIYCPKCKELQRDIRDEEWRLIQAIQHIQADYDNDGK